MILKPLISVIVPIYKVEDKLERCLDSLCRQTQKDIEILLIDDASPDRCGEICEAFAAKDARFRVFHNKTNQGLSVARNIGIEEAVGDYLMFVDGDDYVHEDFCRLPYECSVRYKADLVMFRSQRIKKFGNLGVAINRTKTSRQDGYKTVLEAMDLLQKGVGQAAWNKLYRKELFNNIMYPPGYSYEDSGTTYKMVWRASHIYYLDKVLYYYCYREGSITELITEKSVSDYYEMSMQQYYDLAAQGYPADKLDNYLKNRALSYCIMQKPDDSNARYVFCKNVLLESKSLLHNTTGKRKFMFLLFKYCRPLFEVCCILFGKKVRSE